MKTIVFVTGNIGKFQVAQKSFENSNIDIVRQEIETPEIQSNDVEKIASYSAIWAAEKLGEPVVLTDAGYYVNALNGFPGPFIKYINQWLSAEDILKLMKGKKERTVDVKVCLAYCKPGNKPITFVSTFHGTIAQKAVRTNKPGSTPINEIFIPDGYNKVETEIPREEMIKFWSKGESYWNALKDYLNSQ
jgi:XTP/dITP diphosphohydrolase